MNIFISSKNKKNLANDSTNPFIYRIGDQPGARLEVDGIQLTVVALAECGEKLGQDLQVVLHVYSVGRVQLVTTSGL